jgi:hypothetical protein
MAILLLLAVVIILFTNTGCVTAQVAPRMGACLIDEGGNWFCKDADKNVVPRSTNERYVCQKLDEWTLLMNFCKKPPSQK